MRHLDAALTLLGSPHSDRFVQVLDQVETAVYELASAALFEGAQGGTEADSMSAAAEDLRGAVDRARGMFPRGQQPQPQQQYASRG